MNLKRLIAWVMVFLLMTSTFSTVQAAELTKKVLTDPANSESYNIYYYASQQDMNNNDYYKSHYYDIIGSKRINGVLTGGKVNYSSIETKSFYEPANMIATHTDFYTPAGVLSGRNHRWTKNDIDYIHQYNAQGQKIGDWSYNRNDAKYSGYSTLLNYANGNRSIEKNYDTNVKTSYFYDQYGLSYYYTDTYLYYAPAGKEAWHFVYYDATGRQIFTKYRWMIDSIWHEHQYDASGTFVSDYSYNYNTKKWSGCEVIFDETTGLPKQEINHDLGLQTFYDYNAANDLTGYRVESTAFYPVIGDNVTYNVYYDPMHNQVASESKWYDKDGNYRTHRYDAKGNLCGDYTLTGGLLKGYKNTLDFSGLIRIEANYDQGLVTDYSYNKYNALLGTSTRSLAYYEPAKGSAWQFVKYDPYGNFIGGSRTFEDADQRIHTHYFNADLVPTGGNVITPNEYLNEKCIEQFNSNNELISISYEQPQRGGVKVTKTYSPQNELLNYAIERIIPGNCTQIEIFDPFGNLLITYVYDEWGTEISRTLPKPNYTWYPSNTMCTS